MRVSVSPHPCHHHTTQRFFCYGFCVTGPSWKSGLGSLALLIAPTVVFLVWVAPYMAQHVTPAILVIRCARARARWVLGRRAGATAASSGKGQLVAARRPLPIRTPELTRRAALPCRLPPAIARTHTHPPPPHTHTHLPPGRSCVLPVVCVSMLLLTSCRDPGILPRQEPDEEWLQARKPRCAARRSSLRAAVWVCVCVCVQASGLLGACACRRCRLFCSSPTPPQPDALTTHAQHACRAAPAFQTPEPRTCASTGSA